MNIKVSEAVLADVPIIGEILSSGVNYKIAHDDLSWGSGVFTDAEVIDWLDKHSTYVVELDGETVGTVSLFWNDELRWGELDTEACYIHRLAIRDGFHGQGLGKQVVDWAIDQTAQKGLNLVRLDCNADNKSLCDYYQDQGFVLIDSRWIEHFKSNVALFERKI